MMLSEAEMTAVEIIVKGTGSLVYSRFTSCSCLSLESCTLWKIWDSDHCIILRKKVQNANHVLVTIAKYIAHKNNLMPILGLDFWRYGLCWVLKYLMCFCYLRQRDKPFSVIRTQACLFAEAIEPTPAYPAEREFTKAVARLFEWQKTTQGCNEVRITKLSLP